MVLTCMDPRFQPLVYEYLKKRKINNSIIKECKIGFVNFNSSIYEKLRKNHDVKILNESGLFSVPLLTASFCVNSPMESAPCF